MRMCAETATIVANYTYFFEELSYIILYKLDYSMWISKIYFERKNTIVRTVQLNEPVLYAINRNISFYFKFFS